jgi:predicted MPP superfamily phosphohydrolase
MKKLFLALISLLVFWALFIEPNSLTVTNLNVKISGLRGLKVVFIGDLHIKTNQKKRLDEIVKKINEQHPDLILSAGDFVSGHEPKQSLAIEEIAKSLSILKPKYGFYAVLGNHDWWQGGERIKKVLVNNGIIVLSNENKVVDVKGKKLYIAGVEDMSTRNIDLVKALKNVQHPAILMTHTPDVFPFVAGKASSNIVGVVDLTLAGHTHGGQINIPFIGPLVVPSRYGAKYAQGLIERNDKTMFVTKGIGTSILPVRFNCSPEIVVIDFN